MAALKKPCISLRGDVVGSKEKVTPSASFHFISQRKRLRREVVVLKGYFHQGQSIFPIEMKSH